MELITRVYGAAGAAQAAHLSMLERHEAGLRSQELEMERKLANLRVARQVAASLREVDAGVHAELEQTEGLYREKHTLAQKGELQKLIQKNTSEKADKYGFLYTVIERVQPTEDCASLILGASKLYTNKLSMAPDPYIKIFRRLAAPDDSSLDPNMPALCPVYKSSLWYLSLDQSRHRS